MGTNNIQSKEDFILFVDSLIENFKSKPEEWENRTLENFLLALSSWIEDMDGYYENTNQSIPEDINWKVFADILNGAKVYE